MARCFGKSTINPHTNRLTSSGIAAERVLLASIESRIHLDYVGTGIDRSPSRQGKPSQSRSGSGSAEIAPVHRIESHDLWTGLWTRIQKVPELYLKPSARGGESGIRTHETLTSLHAFQACAFNHSAISPFAQLRSGAHYTHRCPERNLHRQNGGYKRCVA